MDTPVQSIDLMPASFASLGSGFSPDLGPSSQLRATPHQQAQQASPQDGPDFKLQIRLASLLSHAAIEHLRNLVKQSLEIADHSNAQTFADLLVTMSCGKNEDVLLLARSHMALGEHRLALDALKKYDLLPNLVDANRDTSFSQNLSRSYLHGTCHDPTGIPLRAAYLAAKCLTVTGEADECIFLLEQALGGRVGATAAANEASNRVRDSAADMSGPGLNDLMPPPTLRNVNAAFDALADGHIERGSREAVDLRASCCALLGEVYCKQEKPDQAVMWLQFALRIDVYCFDAFNTLIRNRLLPAAQESVLLDSLPFILPQDGWLKALYKTFIVPNDQSNSNGAEERFAVPELSVLTGADGSREPNVLLLAAKANLLWSQNDIDGAHQVARTAYELQPLNETVIPIYVASMVELKLKAQLYYCAHTLVEALPQKPVAWFAVGCYYLLVKKFDIARRYFQKATKIDPSFAYAWIANGHACAASDESEQALAMYRAASRLFQGTHEPLMFMGMEYLKTNNRNLSSSFLLAAHDVNSFDPMVHNELGVTAFKDERYLEARDHFLVVLRVQRNPTALVKSEDIDLSPLVEDASTPNILQNKAEGQQIGILLHPSCCTAVLNLGQCNRKLRHWSSAIRCFEAALTLDPKNPSNLSALAFTYHLTGNLEPAIEAYHQALALSPDDTFCSEMLNKALNELSSLDTSLSVAELGAEIQSIASRSQLASRLQNDESELMEQESVGMEQESVGMEQESISMEQSMGMSQSQIGGEKSYDLDESSMLSTDMSTE